MATVRRPPAGGRRRHMPDALGMRTEGFTAARTVGPKQHNLPSAATSFVGRESELGDIKELLSSTRILTISGAGGCGKTRLALQAAAESPELYSGGVWFVDLAPVSDPNQVVAAMVASMGLREQPGRALLETAIDYLESRQVLLLMDNCEHRVEACAGLAARLTRSAPMITVLATSREPLRVAGEKVWRVPSLDEQSAVELFEQRARQLATAFVMTPDNALTVTAICARLG